MKKWIYGLFLVALVVSVAIPAISTPAFADSAVTVAWDASAGANFYTLHMIAPDKSDTVIADNITDVTATYTYTSQTVSPGMYSFYLTASNDQGTSKPSETVSKWLGPPDAPSKISITIKFITQ